ncbi:MAG: hypothetical protein USCAAHI_00115 [Beijerinckiaceae bacterium]|jgi:hypothetical protein|nr:MAG: hypothetical protein USCAAHI_00115 [Beijerinckiaceae bacterium]
MLFDEEDLLGAEPLCYNLQGMNSYNNFSPAQRMRALRWLRAEYAAGRRHPPLVCDACGQTEGVIP